MMCAKDLLDSKGKAPSHLDHLLQRMCDGSDNRPGDLRCHGHHEGPQPDGTYLIGRVSELGPPGRAISGAEVRVGERLCFSDQFGRYRLNISGLVLPEQVEVSVRGMGRAVETLSIEEAFPGGALIRNYQLLGAAYLGTVSELWVAPEKCEPGDSDWLVNRHCLCPAAATLLGVEDDDGDLVHLFHQEAPVSMPMSGSINKDGMSHELAQVEAFMDAFAARLNGLLFHEMSVMERWSEAR